jgi:hypothetical protein
MEPPAENASCRGKIRTDPKLRANRGRAAVEALRLGASLGQQRGAAARHPEAWLIERRHKRLELLTVVVRNL